MVSLNRNFALDYCEYAVLCRKYVVFTFSVLEQENTFLDKSRQKNQKSRKLVLRLIRIRRIQ